MKFRKISIRIIGAFVVMPNHVHGILIIDHGVIPADIELLLESNSVNSNKGVLQEIKSYVKW